MSVLGDAVKIVPALLKGHRKVDLPWVEPEIVPDVVPNIADIYGPTEFLQIPPFLVVDQIQFALDQIVQATERIQVATQQILRDRVTIAQFEDQVANHPLFLDVGIHSGHKGRWCITDNWRS